MNPGAPEKLGRLGLGTGTLASLGRAASLKEVQGILEAMVEAEIDVIDTADSYGSGDCEVLLGRALRGCPDHFKVVTKAGYRHGNLPGVLRPLNQFVKKALQKVVGRQCFDPMYLECSLEASLRRLGCSSVEGFLLHDPPERLVTSPPVMEAMRRLKQRGLARSVGVSSGELGVLKSTLGAGWCDLVESPANPRDALGLLDVWDSCGKAGIKIIGNHIYAPGLLQNGKVGHELLMRASAGLLPPEATLLCGTRNPVHLRQSLEWSLSPLGSQEALEVARNCQPGNPDGA